MCPNWVSCCAPWLDIPAGCSVVLSGPMMGTHCIQPIAFVTECRRFGLMQFPSLQLPFFILALRLFRHSRSLLSAGCKFGFCCIANVAPRGPRVALLGMRVIVVHPYSPPFFLPSPSVCRFTHPPVHLSTCPPVHLSIRPIPFLFPCLFSSLLRVCSGFASSLLLAPS